MAIEAFLYLEVFDDNFLKLAKVGARSVRRIDVSYISDMPPVQCIHILALDQNNQI